MSKLNFHEGWEFLVACFKTLVLVFEYLLLVVLNNALIGLFINIYSFGLSVQAASVGLHHGYEN